MITFKTHVAFYVERFMGSKEELVHRVTEAADHVRIALSVAYGGESRAKVDVLIEPDVEIGPQGRSSCFFSLQLTVGGSPLAIRDALPGQIAEALAKVMPEAREIETLVALAHAGERSSALEQAVFLFWPASGLDPDMDDRLGLVDRLPLVGIYKAAREMNLGDLAELAAIALAPSEPSPIEFIEKLAQEEMELIEKLARERLEGIAA